MSGIGELKLKDRDCERNVELLRFRIAQRRTACAVADSHCQASLTKRDAKRCRHTASNLPDLKRTACKGKSYGSGRKRTAGVEEYPRTGV